MLTVAEAELLKANLVEGLTAFWEGLDQAISFTNRQKAEAYIWQTIDEEETEYLADGILAVALKNKAAAAAVRGIAQSSRLMKTGAILMPRFMQMMVFYSQHGGLHIGGLF